MANNNQKNVLGNSLKKCSIDPLTGFMRDGCCSVSERDRGNHIICAEVNNKFLNFSYLKGNDLITPRMEFSFPGLKEGDRWCLCLDRWLEALKNDCAPKIILESTNSRALEKVDIEILKRFALDLN